MTNIRPNADKILLEKIEVEEKRSSGLIVPNYLKREKDVRPRGRVVAVGSGKFSNNGTVLPIQAKPGDIVVYSKARAIDITEEEKDYVLVPESDILYYLD